MVGMGDNNCHDYHENNYHNNWYYHNITVLQALKLWRQDGSILLMWIFLSNESYDNHRKYCIADITILKLSFW